MIFIELGMDPRIACATGMYMTMYNSIFTAGAYAIEGFFDDMYIFVFCVLSISAAIIGVFINELLTKKLKRTSFIILLLSINFLIAGITIPHAILNRVFGLDSIARVNQWD